MGFNSGFGRSPAEIVGSNPTGVKGLIVLFSAISAQLQTAMMKVHGIMLNCNHYATYSLKQYLNVASFP